MQVAIVGAGVAGLAAAWELTRRNIPHVVLERAPQPGGVVVTERVDGFVLDAGPDSLLVQKPAAIDLCREIGIADRLLPMLPPRKAFVLRGGELVPLPEASFLGLPTRLSSFAASPLFSLRGKLRMAAELLIAEGDHADESIGSFMTRRFGVEARDYLAEPLLAGIHAGDVDRLSIHALFPRLVDMERQSGSVLRALATARRRSPSQSAFVSFPGGLRELVEAVAARLDPAALRLNTTVDTIGGRGPYAVTLNTGETIAARAVIVAVPAWAAAALLRSLDADLAARCASIAYVSSATVLAAFSREQVQHPLDGSGFVVPRREGRALMAATWVSSKWPQRAPDGHVLLRAFLGGARDEQIVERGDDDLIGIAMAELRAILRIDGDPIFARVFRWRQSTPQYHVGHLDTVRAIDRNLEALPGLFLTGSAYRGTGIPDCVADGRAVAAEAAAFLR